MQRIIRTAVTAGLLIASSLAAAVIAAAPAEAAPVICEKFGGTYIQNNTLRVQNNVWGADTAQCIDVNQSGGFTVTQANHNNATNGAPAAYPSIYAGCHYAQCTSGSGLPMQASASGFGNVRTSVNMTYPSSGTWNAAYDLWFDPTPRTDGQNTGAEIMVWANYQGSIQPVGSQVATVNILGATWQVWYGNIGWNVVSYRRTSATTSLNFAIDTFLSDAISRGYAQRSWYLTSVQAGFEPWVGGTGLAVNSFSYTTSGTGGDTQPPSTPGNLSASNVTSSGASLSWNPSTDNVGVTGYDVYRRQGTSGTFTQVGSSTTTSFAATGLSASTQYQFYVIARDAAGNSSAQSNTVTLTTSGTGGDTSPPSVPQNLTVSGTTSSSVSLSWSASTDNVGVVGYDVLRAPGTSGGTFTVVGTASGTSFTNSGLTANTTFRYQVRARDAAGNTSAVSSTVTATTQGGGSASCTYRIDFWNTGYVVYVTVNGPATGWSFTVTLPAGHTFVGGWSAVFTTGNPFTATPMSWNNNIPAGQSTQWGFQASRPDGNTALPTIPNCTRV
jgi:chitodextrinase